MNPGALLSQSSGPVLGFNVRQEVQDQSSLPFSSGLHGGWEDFKESSVFSLDWGSHVLIKKLG